MPLAAEALQRWRMRIGIARANGVVGNHIEGQDGLWDAHSGQYERACEFIEASMTHSRVIGLPALKGFETFGAMAKTPCYRALADKERSRINALRKALKLAPLKL
jgi:hypothetical protein